MICTLEILEMGSLESQELAVFLQCITRFAISSHSLDNLKSLNVFYCSGNLGLFAASRHTKYELVAPD